MRRLSGCGTCRRMRGAIVRGTHLFRRGHTVCAGAGRCVGSGLRAAAVLRPATGMRLQSIACTDGVFGVQITHATVDGDEL